MEKFIYGAKDTVMVAGEEGEQASPRPFHEQDVQVV